MENASDTTTRGRNGASLTIAVHAVLIGLACAYLGLSTASGANIGQAFGLLAVGILGAPWSLLILLNERFTLDSPAFIALAAAGATANFAMHVLMLSWLRRRRRAR